MWLILTFSAAVITTLLWYKFQEKKYNLGFLSSILWGATIMWIVDHVIAYLKEGEEFLEININATLLGLVIIISAIIMWVFTLIRSENK